MRSQKKLLIEQLDRKLEPFKKIALNPTMPDTGWIRTIRQSLNMTLRQLAAKINITSQGVRDIEQREKMGTLTINTLQDVARAFDMELIYGFAPKDKSVNAYVDRKALELASQIIKRTNQSMKLEDQQNETEVIMNAVNELKDEIKREMRKSLWE